MDCLSSEYYLMLRLRFEDRTSAAMREEGTAFSIRVPDKEKEAALPSADGDFVARGV